jgi:hypothetical protein
VTAEAGADVSENQANLRIGCGMQQARSVVMEKTVEVVRNGKDGTRRAAGTARPKWKRWSIELAQKTPSEAGVDITNACRWRGDLFQTPREEARFPSVWSPSLSE